MTKKELINKLIVFHTLLGVQTFCESENLIIENIDMFIKDVEKYGILINTRYISQNVVGFTAHSRFDTNTICIYIMDENIRNDLIDLGLKEHNPQYLITENIQLAYTALVYLSTVLKTIKE